MVVCLGLSNKKWPKDEIMNLLLFRQLHMACERIEAIYVRF